MTGPGEALERMDPDDGYRVTRSSAAGQAWLQSALVVDGQPEAGLTGSPLELASCPLGDPEGEGRLDRLSHALNAVCRYLNTGGTWAELDRSLAHLRVAAPGGRALGPYYYAGGALTDEGCYEHAFVRRGDGGRLVWVEGQYVETLPPAPDHDGDEQDGRGGPGGQLGLPA